MRLKALNELKYTEIPVIIADEWNEEQKAEFLIKDNVGFGEWDWDSLANEWEAEKLGDWGLDLPVDLSVQEELEAEEDNYEIPNEINTDIVIGDLFEIGEHRLLCGDSTDSDSVAKLMNVVKADMVFTDPPYDLENEDYHSNIYLFTENAHIFVMHDDKGIVNYLRLSNLEFSRFYVANFGFSSPRGNDPYLSHILISQEKNGKAIPHKNMHDGFRSIIPMEYRFRLKDDKTEHKHQKPIKFISTFIEHFSNNNAIILDLFLGSGSTMVASHQLKRKCYGMELDPKYCQVIVDRMKKLDPSLVIKKNGVEIK
jgi:DNA modification methylase